MAIQRTTGGVSGYTAPKTTTTPFSLIQRPRTLEDEVRDFALWGSRPAPYSPYVSTTPRITLGTPTTSGGGGGSGTGVFRGFRLGGGKETAPMTNTPLNWNDILNRAQAPYDALTAQLRALAETERGNITNATSQAVSSLGSVDPMAGYRETYRSAEAGPAAAMSYLGAIGANPAQVEAQRNLSNQLIAAQSASQQGFGSAVDQSNQNYRLAQLSEAYLNQQRAQAGLGASLGSQEAAIGLAATQQRNEIARLILETQLQLLTQQSGQGGYGGYGDNKEAERIAFIAQSLGLGA